jgi:hypothetical protein
MPATFPVTGFRWYFGRLARDEDVVLRRLPEDLPSDALAEVDHVVETGFKANIPVPIRVGANSICALATGMFRSHRDWTPREMERLRTLGHILAHSLDRARTDAALRASIAEITALKEQLEAENIYLREEIRSRDDFGEIDVRVIAATNRDLPRAMTAGQFREDLYYRLSVFPIRVPPLRERRDDIPLLVWRIINRRQGPLGRQVTGVPRQVMDTLVAYRWPGNVRELENVIERALILTPGSELRLADSLDDPAGTAASDHLADADRLHILRVLDRCGGRINGPGNAADVLGLHPNTLRSRLKKLGIARSGATFATR